MSINKGIIQEEHTSQLRGLLDRLKTVEKQSGAVASIVKGLPDDLGFKSVNKGGDYGMVNLVNVGDFNFDDSGYNAFAYTGSADFVAEWYKKALPNDAWTLSTSAANSPQAIKNDSLLQTFWDKASGLLRLGAGDILGQRLANNYASVGNRLFIRFEIAKKDAAVVLSPSISLKVSVFDNTTGQLKTLEGAVKTVSGVKAGASGILQRKYLLKVILANGDFYYSDITSAGAATVANTLSVSDRTNPTANYVEVSWTASAEQVAYQLMRHDSEFAEWRMVAEITNGATSFRDSGGRDGILFVAPTVQINSKAISTIKNIGGLITNKLQEVIMALRIPSGYNFAATAAKSQWLQIQFVKADGTPCTLTEVPAGSIVIDKVGMSYAGGKWLPSAKDQQTTAASTTTTPPTTTGGGTSSGSTSTTSDGDGTVGCVPINVMNVKVRSFDESDMQIKDIPVQEVYLGKILIGKDKDGNMAMSRVKRVFPAKTKKLYVFVMENGLSLPCSPSHPIIRNAEDNEGTAAFRMEEEGEVLTSPSSLKIEQSKIDSIEEFRFSDYIDTVTFEVELHTMTLIFNGVFCHNLSAKESQPIVF